MRIRRPKLQLPHPFIIAAFAMVWPLCATLLTAEATPPHEHDAVAAKTPAALQIVEVQADKLWRQVAAVPERIRAHLRLPRNEDAS